MIDKESVQYQKFLTDIKNRIIENPLILNLIEDIIKMYNIDPKEAMPDILSIIKQYDLEIAKTCKEKNILDFNESLKLYFEANSSYSLDTLGDNYGDWFKNELEGEDRRASFLHPKESEFQVEEQSTDEYVNEEDIIIQESQPNLIEEIIKIGTDKRRIIIDSGFGGMTKGDNLIPEILEKIKNRQSEFAGIRNKVFFRFEHQSQSKEPRIIPLDKIIEDEKFLSYIVDEIKKRNFSPFEMYVAVYDITKNLKKTNTPNEEVSDIEGKRLHYILNNAYYVCTGHAVFFKELCTRLELPCVYIELKKIHHISNYIYVKDSKYGINGFYPVESTWEGNVEEERDGLLKNTYIFFALTSEDFRTKYCRELSILYSSDEEKIDVKDYDMFLTAKTPEELRQTDLNAMVGFIYALDREEYFKLFGESKLIRIKPSKLSDQLAQKIIEYFSNRTNRTIPIEKKLDAIMNVKKAIYKGCSQQDFIDLRMNYLTQSREFLSNNETKTPEDDKFEQYTKQRYQQIKNLTLSEAKEKNIFLDITKIIRTIQLKTMSKTVFFLIDTKLGKTIDLIGKSLDRVFFSPEIINEEYYDKIMEKKHQLNLKGIQILSDGEKSAMMFFPASTQKTIEENMKLREEAIQYVYEQIGIEYETKDNEIDGKNVIE